MAGEPLAAEPDLGLSAAPELGRRELLESPATVRLSMNEITTYRWSLLQDVAAYQEAGVGAIGVWRPKLAVFGDERGTDLLRESGLAVSSLAWAGGFTGANGHSFLEAVDDALEAIALAAALAADCLVLVSGARGGHTANHARRLLIDALRRLLDEAADRKVPLALEPMHAMFAEEWTFLNTLDETLEVLDRVDHPYLQVAFDAYHLWQEPRLLERIPALAARTASVRLSDWRDPPRSDSDRCLPGDGMIPLSEIVSAFVEHGYGGYFEIEIWSEELWNSDYVSLLAECRTRFAGLCPDHAAPRSR
ncbi:MAG: sugar phosphate isomerase/epimerase family protein [Planctomycetales bacterium]